MQYINVDTDAIRIGQSLPEGHYACTEDDGSIVIRDLKTESRQWGEWREGINSCVDYPYCKHYNWQYVEMYHWGESAPLKCDYEKLECYLKPGDVVVDVGANIGMFTRLALERGVKEVYAFEPSADVFKCLLLNTTDIRVKSHRACLHNYDGWVDVELSKYPMATMITGDEGIHELIDSVPCYTLNTLMDSGVLPSTIDFLKVDVEGCEIEVFEGLSDENLSRIDRLSMESHHAPEQIPNRNDLVTELLRRLCDAFTYSYQMVYRQHTGNDYWTQTINLWRNVK